MNGNRDVTVRLIDTCGLVVSSTVSGNTSRTSLVRLRCVISLACLLITRIGVCGFSQYSVSGISGRVSYVFQRSYDLDYLLIPYDSRTRVHDSYYSYSCALKPARICI